MIMSREKYLEIRSKNHPSITYVDESWTSESINKNSSSKWKKLVIDLFNEGYDVFVKEAGPSKYITISSSSKAIVVRVSNHLRTVRKGLKSLIPSERKSAMKKEAKWREKHGSVALIVGVGGVSVKDAYQLIKETL